MTKESYRIHISVLLVLSC